MRDHKLLLPILTFALCGLVVIVSGYILFGQQIFNQHLVYFQFVVFGPLVGAMIAVVPRLRPRWLFMIGVLAYLLVVIQTGSHTPTMILRDMVWVGGLVSGVKVGLLSEHRVASWRRGRFLAWTAIFAGVYAVALIFLILVKTQALTVNSEFLWRNVGMGALLGTGIGIGRELARAIHAKIRSLPAP